MWSPNANYVMEGMIWAKNSVRLSFSEATAKARSVVAMLANSARRVRRRQELDRRRHRYLVQFVLLRW